MVQPEFLTSCWDKRLSLLPETNFYRVVHLTEHPSFTLDRAGDVGILSLYSEVNEQHLIETITQTLPLQSLYIKRRPEAAHHKANTEREFLAPTLPVWGETVPEHVVQEQGVRYCIRSGGDLSVGLFGDMRSGRAWLKKNGSGKRVLNTFAYTCGLGLCAALGGASEVKNIDASQKVLAWGKENYLLNGLQPRDQDFIYGDVLEWLERWVKKGEKFDTIVLDPPSFSRSKTGKVWRAEKNYPELFALAYALLNTGGEILACTNHAGFSLGQFRALLTKAQTPLQYKQHLAIGWDYPKAEHLKITLWQ